MTTDAERSTRDAQSPIDDTSRVGPAVHEQIQASYSGYEASDRKRRAWDSTNPGNRALQAELARALRSIAAPELSGTGPILDVGCGTGIWLRELNADVEVSRLCGVDLLEARLEAARRSLPGANYAHADARSLPFESNKFALLLLLNVLPDLPRPDGERVLAECRRVLAPGGLLLIYAPRIPTPFNRSTRWIRPRDISLPTESRTITSLPPLTRRLGRLTPFVYPALARVRPLRTHRLWAYRKPPIGR